jgi:hypothetical protein
VRVPSSDGPDGRLCRTAHHFYIIEACNYGILAMSVSLRGTGILPAKWENLGRVTPSAQRPSRALPAAPATGYLGPNVICFHPVDFLHHSSGLPGLSTNKSKTQCPFPPKPWPNILPTLPWRHSLSSAEVARDGQSRHRKPSGHLSDLLAMPYFSQSPQERFSLFAEAGDLELPGRTCLCDQFVETGIGIF